MEIQGGQDKKHRSGIFSAHNAYYIWLHVPLLEKNNYIDLCRFAAPPINHSGIWRHSWHQAVCPAKTRRWTNVVLMLGHSLRRWPNIKTTFGSTPCVCWMVTTHLIIRRRQFAPAVLSSHYHGQRFHNVSCGNNYRLRVNNTVLACTARRIQIMDTWQNANIQYN